MKYSKKYKKAYELYINGNLFEALNIALNNYEYDDRFYILIPYIYEIKRDGKQVFYWCNLAIKKNISDGHIFIMLAELYFYGAIGVQKNIKKSIYLHKKGLFYYKEILQNTNKEVVHINFSIGYIYYSLEEYKKALVYFRKSMKYGHIYAFFYFIYICSEKEYNFGMNLLQIILLGYQKKIIQFYLNFTNKEDIRINKGLLSGNKILGDTSIIKSWVNLLKK